MKKKKIREDLLVDETLVLELTLVPPLPTRGQYRTALRAASPKSAPDWRTVSLPPLVTYDVQN